MAHRGRLYPFADFFWQIEAVFWPGAAPRKLLLASLGVPSGDSWDLLGPGVVTDAMVPDVGIAGDCTYSYVDPLGAFLVDVLFHKVLEHPKRYTLSLRMELPSAHAQIIYQEFGPAIDDPRFTGPWLTGTTDPPFFVGGPHNNVRVRPALWSEM